MFGECSVSHFTVVCVWDWFYIAGTDKIVNLADFGEQTITEQEKWLNKHK